LHKGYNGGFACWIDYGLGEEHEGYEWRGMRAEREMRVQ